MTAVPAHRASGATTLGALLRSLSGRGGWQVATPSDPYTAAAGIQWWEPVMPARTGHTPARLTVAGDVLALSTYDRAGAQFESVAWDWVDAGNLARVHAYVTEALQAALADRGER